MVVCLSQCFFTRRNMSRPSYEQYRATRARNHPVDVYPRSSSGVRRRGSLAEQVLHVVSIMSADIVHRSETDLESLASYSTHHSSTSFSPNGGNAQHPYPLPHSRLSSSSASASASPSLAQNPYYLSSRQRTYSSTSHTSSHLEPPTRSSSSGRVVSLVTESPAARAERRARRREDRRLKQLEKSTLSGGRFDSPIRRWLRWMKTIDMGKWSLPVGIIGVGVIKAAVATGGFSGKQVRLGRNVSAHNRSSTGRDTPPMYGDFEAQRHWMEITIHKPMREWYTYGPEWWQLDCELSPCVSLCLWSLTGSNRSASDSVYQLHLRSNVRMR